MRNREQALNEWLEGRPAVIKDLAAKYPPWFLYRLTNTGQHCYLISYSEDGTVTVNVCGHDDWFLGAINEVMPVQVFGVKPDDLERIETASH